MFASTSHKNDFHPVLSGVRPKQAHKEPRVTVRVRGGPQARCCTVRRGAARRTWCGARRRRRACASSASPAPRCSTSTSASPRPPSGTCSGQGRRRRDPSRSLRRASRGGRADRVTAPEGRVSGRRLRSASCRLQNMLVCRSAADGPVKMQRCSNYLQSSVLKQLS